MTCVFVTLMLSTRRNSIVAKGHLATGGEPERSEDSWPWWLGAGVKELPGGGW
jgi:hypothetical protein